MLFQREKKRSRSAAVGNTLSGGKGGGRELFHIVSSSTGGEKKMTYAPRERVRNGTPLNPAPSLKPMSQWRIPRTTRDMGHGEGREMFGAYRSAQGPKERKLGKKKTQKNILPKLAFPVSRVQINVQERGEGIPKKKGS